MPIPVGFQLGLELTNLVGPLTRAALGAVGIRGAIDRSGSDDPTEQKLAAIFGRHILDSTIAHNFRVFVTPSKQTTLSRVLEDLAPPGFVLASGAGPSVTRALAGNAGAGLLSMLVQTSFLAWSHDHQTLATAIVQIVEEILRKNEGTVEHGLDYVKLLATIVTCQQQTIGFNWEDYYKRVDEMLESGTLLNDNRNRTPKRQRLGKPRPASKVSRQSILTRGIPYTIFQALLQALNVLQRFPEEFLLEISTDRGISSIVIWCYHILGISISVQFSHDVRFGEEPYLIIVKHCDEYETSAVLLRRENMERLFELSRDDLDPYIETDRRAPAKGFLKAVLEMDGFKDEQILKYGHWVLSKCRDHCGQHLRAHVVHHTSESTASGAATNAEPPPPDNENTGVTSRGFLLRDELEPTICFLLGIEEGSFDDMSKTEHPPKSTLRRSTISSLSHTLVICLVYSFTRVRNKQEACSFPLSFDAFDRLSQQDFPVTYAGGETFGGQVPDTVECFNLLCKLLLSGRYKEDFTDKAFLVSDRGWSVFFGTMDAFDPVDALSDRLFIKPGVPARDGVRKARIVDGMTSLGLSSTGTLKLGSDIEFWPNVHTSKLVGAHVGYADHDAFTVLQTYDWAHGPSTCKKWRLGFRDKQNISMRFEILVECRCVSNQSSETSRQCTIDNLIWPQLSGDLATETEYIVKYPKKRSDACKTPERVFKHKENWFFFVTGHGDARWLGLDGLSLLDVQIAGYIRGPGCCVTCAIKSQFPGPALILL